MISSAYSYYLSQYAARETARTDNAARRPSDLRRAYNKMLGINRLAPAYKTDVSLEAQKYAIDLKENARELSSIADELSGSDNDSLIIRQSAISDNPEAVSAVYVGSGDSGASSFSVSVHQLATTQINTGNFLPPSSKLLEPGDYSFDLNMSDITYEFEFGVSDNDNSRSIQDKISRLINRSNIGLSADICSDDMGNTALRIESADTGISGMKPVIFDFKDNETPAAQNTPAAATLGLDRVTQHPSNAVYSIDGNQRTSTSNKITINKEFELCFHSVQEEPPVNIALKADSDAIVDSINELIGGYNNLISVATGSDTDTFEGSARLRRQFSQLSRSYSGVLSQSGLDVNDNGTISVNKDAILTLADEGGLGKVYDSLGHFKDALHDTAERIAMNPMDYVNNKIIAYKNPRRVMTDPYNLSAYSGMMFNGYI